MGYGVRAVDVFSVQFSDGRSNFPGMDVELEKSVAALNLDRMERHIFRKIKESRAFGRLLQRL